MTKRQETLLRKWIDALESGNYAQGEGRLIREHADGSKEYCCLGVLCEVKYGAKHGASTTGEGLGFQFKDKHLAYTTQDLIYDWTGLPTHVEIEDDYTGEYRTVEVESHLADMNDDYDRNFKEIAAFLRDQLPA